MLRIYINLQLKLFVGEEDGKQDLSGAPRELELYQQYFFYIK